MQSLSSSSSTSHLEESTKSTVAPSTPRTTQFVYRRATKAKPRVTVSELLQLHNTVKTIWIDEDHVILQHPEELNCLVMFCCFDKTYIYTFYISASRRTLITYDSKLLKFDDKLLTFIVVKKDHIPYFVRILALYFFAAFVSVDVISIKILSTCSTIFIHFRAEEYISLVKHALSGKVIFKQHLEIRRYKDFETQFIRYVSRRESLIPSRKKMEDLIHFPVEIKESEWLKMPTSTTLSAPAKGKKRIRPLLFDMELCLEQDCQIPLDLDIHTLIDEGRVDILKQQNFGSHEKGFLYSCTVHQPDVTAFFLDGGCDIHIDDDKPLQLAVKHNLVKTVEVLVRHGATISNSILRDAVCLGFLEVTKILLENRADTHSNQELPLLSAVSNGHVEIVDLLLQRGADFSGRDIEAFQLSVKRNFIDVARVFLERNAYTQAQLNTAFWSAIQYQQYHMAKLLLRHGADVHYNNDFALVHAANLSKCRFIRLLCKYGADTNVKNGLPLQTFLQKRKPNFRKDFYSLECIAILLMHGASVECVRKHYTLSQLDEEYLRKAQKYLDDHRRRAYEEIFQ